MAPVIIDLEKRDKFEVIKVSTSQHRQMLDQVLHLFKIEPDYDLDVMKPNQILHQIVEKSVHGFAEILSKAKPEIILVQGDTTTAFTGALAGFYAGIPVGHVEAGLRTWDIHSPYPEEANRRMISLLADYHFTPTENNRGTLIKEGVKPEKIITTGNTVIDALYFILKKYRTSTLAESFTQNGEKLILVTAHRRENFGEPLRKICSALKIIAERYPEVKIVYPVHLNENVQNTVRPMLSGINRISLLEPLNYQDFCTLMDRSYLVLTDSGGIQEEAPSLGKPVLVLRAETERPEAVHAGTVAIVGYETECIVKKTEELLLNSSAYRKMAHAVNPYGDGHAAERIVNFLADNEC